MQNEFSGNRPNIVNISRTEAENREERKEKERESATHARVYVLKKKSKSLNLKNTFYGDTSFFPFNFHHLFANNNIALFFLHSENIDGAIKLV